MEKITEFSVEPQYTESIKFSKDGNSLASLGNDSKAHNTIRLWSLPEKNKLLEFYHPQQAYKSIAFNSTNELLAAGVYYEGNSVDRIIVSHVLKNKVKVMAKCDSMYRGNSMYIRAPYIVLNPECTLVAGIYEEGSICLWQLSKSFFGFGLKKIADLRGRMHGHPCLAFSQDGTFLVAAQPSMVEGFKRDELWVGIADIWNVTTGKLQNTIEVPNLLGIGTIHVSSDNNVLLSTEIWGGLNSFHVWDKKTNKVLTIEHSAKVLSSAVSPDSRFFASGDMAGSLKLSSFPQGKGICTISTNNGAVHHIAFHPEGNTIAFAAGYKIELWRLEKKEMVPVPKSPPDNTSPREPSDESDEKVPCRKCGKMILKRMAVLKDGCCMKCSGSGKSVFAPENFPPATFPEKKQPERTQEGRTTQMDYTERIRAERDKLYKLGYDADGFQINYPDTAEKYCLKGGVGKYFAVMPRGTPFDFNRIECVAHFVGPRPFGPYDPSHVLADLQEAVRWAESITQQERMHNLGLVQK